MRADDRAFVDAAAQVADGAPVDWASAESRADADDRRLIRHLRLVESIASLHRSIPAHDPDDLYSLSSGGTDRALDPGPGGPHWGRLSLRDRIGQGTSCEVYRAWDTALHREVALKLLHDEGAQSEAHGRLLEEARRLARVHHAHVVQVYGAEQHDGRVGLWMELVRGESLERTVQTRGPFGAREAALIGLDLCAALAAVHGAGLLHRDVKAQNVMRENGGRLVLMDFGTGEELSGTNRLVGTPLYLAPEIFRGQRASVQSDLYSLSVLLFYLVTGKFPVNAASMEQLAQAHAHRERQPLRDLRPDLPEVFVATVERALDSDPTRRYQSVGEFESGLRESLDAPAGRAAVRSAPVLRRPRPGLAFLAAVAVLVALVAGLIAWTGRWLRVEPSIQSVAVLPLVDRTGSSSSDFGDAMTEQLIATIAQIDSLRTTSLLSTLPYKETTRPAAEIASALGVDAVLQGVLDVSSSNDRPEDVTLQTSLISAGSGRSLWSGTFQGARGDVRALLARTAKGLASAVNAPVTAAETSRLGQSRPTNPPSEEAYLQGRLQLLGFGPEPARRALASFDRAVELDSGNSAAHAGAALAYVHMGSFGLISHAEARVSARGEIRKAAAGDEDIAEAHAAEAVIRFLYDWDWRGAEREFRRAIDLNPSFVFARDVYSQLLTAERRFDESLKISDETLRLAPNSTASLVSHGMLLYYQRDFAGAAAVAHRAMTGEPGDPAGHFLMARVLEGQGKYAEALTSAAEAAKLSGTPGVNLRVGLIRLQALAGHLAEARDGEADLESDATSGTIRLRSRDRALLHLGFGRTKEALDQFVAAFDERDPALVWLPVEPRVDELRKNPRFLALLQNLQAP